MARRILAIAVVLMALISASVFIPLANAQCSPASGTSGDDDITCDGNDPNGVNTGTGNDIVEIINGIVGDTIISEGGSLLILINGGSLDTSGMGTDAIRINGNGDVDLTGNIIGGHNGILILGNGDILILGNVQAQQEAISLGSGSVSFTGDIISLYSDGIYVMAEGHVSGGGTIDAGGEGIDIGSGSVEFSGTILSDLGSGIVIRGDGTVSASGTINANQMGISLGSGSITFTGDIFADFSDGVHVDDEGHVMMQGNIESGGDGIELGSGSVQFSGNITSQYSDAINIEGEGDVNAGGQFIANQNGIAMGSGRITFTGTIDAYFADGIHIDEDGHVTVLGLVAAGGDGIELGSGQVMLTGGVSSQYSNGIIIHGDGSVTSIGNVTANNNGIVVEGDGSILSDGVVDVDNIGIVLQGEGIIDVYGSISAGNIGVEGGDGAQNLYVDGSIDAPIAVRLNGGNDTFIAGSNSNIQGGVELGAGDDTMWIESGAVIAETIYGGETEETFGDLLIIGSGYICNEDGDAVAMAQGLNNLDPDAGSVTYMGQTYSWSEFEQIANGSGFHPCVGSINDGRINYLDIGAPDALYCIVSGGVSVWEIDLEGHGTFSFAISTEQIEAAFDTATTSMTNTVIDSDTLGNIFYALSDGHTILFTAPELREPGKPYVFTFERGRCPIPLA